MIARMTIISFPPRHVLAYEYFKIVALTLASDGTISISEDESYIVIEDLNKYCMNLQTLASKGKPLWFSRNDRRYVVPKVKSCVKTPEETINEWIKAYTNQLLNKGPSIIEAYEKEEVTSPSTLKATLYEHGRGYGVSSKEEVKLSLNQVLLGLLGAAVSKIGAIRMQQETRSIYLLPIRGQSMDRYISYVEHLRRIPMDVPYSVKCLHIALKALDYGDISDTYGIEVMISERGNRATVIDSHYASSSGFTYSLVDLTSELKSGKQVKLLKWCLNLLIRSYTTCRDATDEASRLAKAIESFCELLLCYINTGSLDYKYNALSTLKRILDDTTAINKSVPKLSRVIEGEVKVEDIRKAIMACINLLQYIRPVVKKKL